jgi:hypothetical protein
MYTIEISWGTCREYKVKPIAAESFDKMISVLQGAWDVNVQTLNISAKVCENDKCIYDGPLNQYVVNGFRYKAMKEGKE